jgi:hypothetical protein
MVEDLLGHRSQAQSLQKALAAMFEHACFCLIAVSLGTNMARYPAA